MYAETTFYEKYPYGNLEDVSRKVPFRRLSELRHIRIEATVDSGYEKGIADSIRLLLQHCPLLEDLELQLLLFGWTSQHFDDQIEPDGALMKSLSGLDLRNGLTLMVKDNEYVDMHVARQLRLNIAPEEMWHCNGWDYIFANFYSDACVQWWRSWTLGKSRGKNLRFQDEPSGEDIKQIKQSWRFWNTLGERLEVHAEIGLIRSLIKQSVACGRRLWEPVNRTLGRR